MRRLRIRFSVGGMLVAIAVVALLLAYLGVLGAIEFVALALIAVTPIAAAPRASRLRVSAWVAAFYPVSILLSFYAFWLFAWCLLGHRPRAWLDDPVRISPHLDGPFLVMHIFVLSSPLSLIACMLIPVVSIQLGMNRGRSRLHEFAPLLIWPVVWPVLFAVWVWDPFHIMRWFVD